MDEDKSPEDGIPLADDDPQGKPNPCDLPDLPICIC